MSETTVNQDRNGQFKTTVPKPIGEAFELDGKKLEWKMGSARNKLELEVKDE